MKLNYLCSKTVSRILIGTSFAVAITATVLWAQTEPSSAPAAPSADSSPSFDHTIAPFVKQNCAMCHNDKLKTGGLVLTKYHSASEMVQDRGTWEKVIGVCGRARCLPKACPGRSRRH